MNRGLTVIRICLATLLLGLSCTAASAASNSNKWRLQFSGGANSDGVIVLRITPVGGAAIDASIAIEDGRGENGVARDVVDALKAQLPDDAFHVERDDGEDVLIKKRHGAADFAVEVVSNDVSGVRINPDIE